MKLRTVLGNNIRNRRKTLGMSAASLSKSARIPKSTLSELESRTSHPSVWTIYKISKALDCTIESLLN